MDSQVITYGIGGAGALMLVLGWVNRAQRSTLWVGGLAAGCSAACAHNDAFWPMITFGLMAYVGALGAVKLGDHNWRMRFGFVSSVCVIAALCLLPTVSAATGGRVPCPEFIKTRVDARLVAGLDLRGGLRLVYTVDVDEAIKDKRDRYYEEMQAELARLLELHEGDDRPSEETYVKLRKRIDIAAPRMKPDTITLKFHDAGDAAKLDQRFMDLFSGDLTFAKAADEKEFAFVIRQAAATEIRGRAVSQAKEIILRRVDELGLREATVSSRDEDIIVEVPGENEASFKEIRDIISQTARLEFKLLDDETDFFGPISTSAVPESLPDGLEFSRENAPVGMDDSGDPINKSTTHARISKVEGETSKDTLTRFRAWVETLEIPPDREIGFQMTYDVDDVTQKQTESGWRTYFLRSRADITGDLIRDAQAAPDQQQGLGGWYVSITFTDQGGAIFERITGANIKRRFAIILDERIESAPVIQSRIAGGRASITLGGSDPETQLRDAKALELVLRSGALPAPITPSNEQHIGPSLGADAIRLGVKGALFSSALVLMFMLIYYSRAGIIANIAVSMNMFLQLAILASFGASMTLPGIAGLALIVGMSVDSNVLINERIREELREGRSPRAAVELGYEKATSAIIDGHLTTLISAVVLAQYGTGPIKGFAVTLFVGVLTSMFCGIIVSRLLFDFWVRGKDRDSKLSMG